MISDGAGKTYEWDAANRLTAIHYTNTTNRSQFVYDGLGRRVQATEINGTITPAGTTYQLYTTAAFTVSGGTYTLTFTGLNPNGGDNTAFIDDVRINGATLSATANAGFETPNVGTGSFGAFQYNPSGAGWTFSGSAGVTGNASGFTDGNPNAPAGTQVGFIQATGSISQSVTLPAGTYTVSFQAAQRGSSNNSFQVLQVTLGSSASTTQNFVWHRGDYRPCEERDGSNNVLRRYYAQGEQIGGTEYFYTRDHLGSVRELTDVSGVVQARYDYDPYGRRTRIGELGSMDANFGYTEHYFHDPSGLHFATSREYDAGLGRWLSRDPIREAGGINLYGYVGNSPLYWYDPLRHSSTEIIK